MAAVLLRMARLDPFDRDPEPQPPDRECAQAVERVRGREGDAVVGADRVRSPNSLNVRSNTVKANFSAVVDSASQVRRSRLAKSVIVSG